MRIGTRGSALALAQAREVATLLGGAEVHVIATSGDRRAGTDAAPGAAGAAAPDAKAGPHAADCAAYRDTASSGDRVAGAANRDAATSGDRVAGAANRDAATSGDRVAGAANRDAATSGDRVAAAAGRDVADKSRWVDAIEAALLRREIDLAVHSAKDVPGRLQPGLALLGTLTRVASEDVLCGAASLQALRHRARVGTSSLRRSAQLLAVRPDLEIVPLRGNVDTRLSRLGGSSDAGGAFVLDAIVVAHAGLRRLKLSPPARSCSLPLERFVPSPGQGALALQGREDDEPVAAAVARIVDGADFARLEAERALAGALGASCHTPLGAHARVDRGELQLLAWIGLPDGSAWIFDSLLANSREEPEQLGLRLAARMRSVGAGEMLAEAEVLARSEWEALPT
jgi:hydroxymethylbilane synthase